MLTVGMSISCELNLFLYHEPSTMSFLRITWNHSSPGTPHPVSSAARSATRTPDTTRVSAQTIRSSLWFLLTDESLISLYRHTGRLRVCGRHNLETTTEHFIDGNVNTQTLWWDPDVLRHAIHHCRHLMLQHDDARPRTLDQDRLSHHKVQFGPPDVSIEEKND